MNERLKKKKFKEKELFEEFYNISKELDLDTKEFFKGAYLVLVNKEKGPRLAPFILTLGEKATSLFSRV